MMDAIAHTERTNGFKDSFRNSITGYLVEKCGWDAQDAGFDSDYMFKAYLVPIHDGSHTSIGALWQFTIGYTDAQLQADAQAAILNMLNRTYREGYAYFQEGKMLRTPVKHQ